MKITASAPESEHRLIEAQIAAVAQIVSREDAERLAAIDLLDIELKRGVTLEEIRTLAEIKARAVRAELDPE